MWGIHRSPVNSPHKGQWRGALIFSLISVWINGWVKVNNRDAGYLRRYHAHYDVTVMSYAGPAPGGSRTYVFYTHMHHCVSIWTPFDLFIKSPLRWRHNVRDSVSNHQSHDCLLNRLFRNRSKLCVTGLCAWNSPGSGEFPAQRASNAENVSISWRHHDTGWCLAKTWPPTANSVFLMMLIGKPCLFRGLRILEKSWDRDG